MDLMFNKFIRDLTTLKSIISNYMKSYISTPPLHPFFGDKCTSNLDSLLEPTNPVAARYA